MTTQHVSSDPIRFDGEVAIVTGAGHGLGRGYARELAARGAAVVCNDLDPERAASVAAEIMEAGGSAVADANSVSTSACGQAIVQRAIDTFGSIEIVVNNAGQLRNAAFEELSIEHIREVIDTHLGGAFNVTQPAYKYMKRAGYGRIVFTSSSAGMFGSPWQTNYGAAKAGVFGLCNVVALEGARYGIAANAVMPMALTGINNGDAPPYAPEDLQATIEALQPLAEHMTVENVVPVVAYLASRRCRATRQVFSVGAGHVARVFVGATRGWYAPGLADITPEQIEASLGAIGELDGFAVPESMNDEARIIGERMPEIRRSTS